MDCPACKSVGIHVLRTAGSRRRRECFDCGHRWSTVELPLEAFREAKSLERERDRAVRAEEAMRRQLLELAAWAKRAAG